MKLVWTLTLSLFICNVYSQDTSRLGFPIQNENEEHLMFQIFYAGWLDSPDSISMGNSSRGINFYLMLDKAIKKSNFKFAIGLGFGTDNIFHDAAVVETDTLTSLTRFPDSLDLDFRTKLVTTYIDLPVELRFRTKPNPKGKSFKMAAGFKVGLLLSSHTKYKGDNPAMPQDDLKQKTYKLRHISDLRYGVTGRIGYGSTSVFVYYGLTELFESKGPQVTPFSVGLTISIY